MSDPQIILQKWGANLMTDTINLESELIGLNRILTKAHPKQDIYTKTCVDSKQIKYPVCDLYTEQSRSILPPFLFRDIPQNNFYFLPLNPQENTCIPFQNNLSTRILEKDYFIPKNICSNISDNSGFLVNSGFPVNTTKYNMTYNK